MEVEEQSASESEGNVDEIHDDHDGMYELLGAHYLTFHKMATNGIVIAFK